MPIAGLARSAGTAGSEFQVQADGGSERRFGTAHCIYEGFYNLSLWLKKPCAVFYLLNLNLNHMLEKRSNKI